MNDRPVGPLQPSRLCVKNISYSTTEDELVAFFDAAGKVVHARISVDRETGHSRGFGFIQFADEREAARARAELDGAELDGRRLSVSVAVNTRAPR